MFKAIMDDIFVKTIEDIPERFIKITTIFTKVSNTYAIDNFPFFFVVRKANSSNRLLRNSNSLKLSIYQAVTDQFRTDCCQKLLEVVDLSKDICEKILVIQNYNLDSCINLILSYPNDHLLKYINDNWFFFKNNIDNPNMIQIATFYNHFGYTNGLIELLKDNNIKKNFKLLITHKNIYNHNRFKMDIHVYIDKVYLNRIYEINVLPLFLFRIFQDMTVQNPFSLEIKESTFFKASEELNCKFKRQPFNYQIRNILWLQEIETLISNNRLIFKTFLNENNLTIFKIDAIDDYLLFNKDGEIKNTETLQQINIIPKGGILCDQVGLGKTFSFLGLISATYNQNKSSTLILCPTRLCKQWSNEIDISINLKWIIISTISQYNKFIKLSKKGNIYPIVIISYKFLNNQNYIKFKENNPNDNSYFIENKFWERIILDEGHEYFDSLKSKQSNFREINEELNKLQCNFKWICSGTPYNNFSSLLNLLKFICQFDESFLTNFNDIKHIGQKLLDNICRKNTKESVKNQVTIPEPNITTHFLDQTEIEKAIYQSSLGNKNLMIQLCSHIIVSDEHMTILGNKPLPLNEIQIKMIQFYQKKISKQNDKLSHYNEKKNKLEEELINLKTVINSLNEKENNRKLSLDEKYNLIQEKILENNLKLKELLESLAENKSKFEIFNNLDKKIKENYECPICYEDLKLNVKTVLGCGHFFCSNCITKVLKKNDSSNCPYCRTEFFKNKLQIIKPDYNKDQEINKWGTKMNYLISYLNNVLSDLDNRIIIFSQWDNLLKLVGNVLSEKNINHLFLNGSIHVLNGRIRKFKLDKLVRVVLLSSEKAVSGLTLTEANHIILLDTLNNDKESSKIIEEQAIGRSVRIGQTKNVEVIRLIMNDTIEYDFYQKNIENKNINI